MTRRGHRARAMAVALLVVLASCSDDGGVDPVDHVSNLITIGLPCENLFSARDDVEPDDARLPELNERLREIGCHSRTSERTDQERSSG